METPEWILLLSFWLHMLATIVWVGGQAALMLLIRPIAKRKMGVEDYADFLRAVNRQLSSIAWVSLALLTATGLVQMSANSNYEGFLAFDNKWSQAMLLKHLTFAAIIVISAYLSWSLTPALQRAQLKRLRGIEQSEEQKLQRREIQLVSLNLLLGIIVLAFTAFARIA
ncbi:MAG: hypothetical protein FVQ83_14655 [Chloroflexi bacterium]|nr:hypothetical protein [Chloroflexota bacterium]